ncbi:extensin [Plutella xylostella]|uniref:extensin n=1 Tax=Plutella xylostella TaxID=51655 RepID=UPI0020326372|nr:extensin [Plutella xylostella]
MTHAAASVVVFALLTRCSAEISNNQPTAWYAANVITDPGFSPKPLSEIFPTDKTFSPAMPIVVLSSTTQLPAEKTESPSTETPVPTTAPQTLQGGSQNPYQVQNSTPGPFSTQNTPGGFQIQNSPPFPFQNGPPGQFPFQNGPPGPFPFQNGPQGAFWPQNGPSGPFPTPNITPSPFPAQNPQQQFSTETTSQVNTAAPSTFAPTQAPNQPSTTVAAASTVAPLNASRPTIPYVRIRMQSPSGAITNIQVNQPTTIRRPTTTRRTRRRKNNYDDCVDACGGRRTPVCAAPLASNPIDPDTLKGFPSICHMACHNSFRKNLFEKVVDGRCGHLRTRIQTIDSNTKLKRNQLNRLQYSVVQSPSTVIEFNPVS